MILIVHFRRNFFRKTKNITIVIVHATIIEHKRIKNNIARQIFTRNGPLAFLPYFTKNTSIVYSARGEKKCKFKI